MDEKRFNPRRCRWIRREMYGLRQREAFLRKEMIKKESPNEGTETTDKLFLAGILHCQIKKEFPNEGTETNIGQS